MQALSIIPHRDKVLLHAHKLGTLETASKIGTVNHDVCMQRTLNGRSYCRAQPQTHHGRSRSRHGEGEQVVPQAAGPSGLVQPIIDARFPRLGGDLSGGRQVPGVGERQDKGSRRSIVLVCCQLRSLGKGNPSRSPTVQHGTRAAHLTTRGKLERYVGKGRQRCPPHQATRHKGALRYLLALVTDPPSCQGYIRGHPKEQKSIIHRSPR